MKSDDSISKTNASLIRHLCEDENHKAWADFVSVYTPKLRDYCRAKRVPEGEVGDLIQEVFIRLLQGIKTYDASRPFRPWLRTVLHRAWIDALRKKPRVSGTGDSEVQKQLAEAPGGDLMKELDEMIEDMALREALGRVKEKANSQHWAIFYAVTFEGKTLTQAAQAYNVSLQTAGMAKLRVRRALEEEMNKLDKGNSPEVEG